MGLNRMRPTNTVLSHFLWTTHIWAAIDVGQEIMPHWRWEYVNTKYEKKRRKYFVGSSYKFYWAGGLSVTDRPQGFSYFALYFCCVDCDCSGDFDCSSDFSSVNDRRTQFPSFRAHFLWPLPLMQFVVAFLNVFRSANYSKHAIVIMIITIICIVVIARQSSLSCCTVITTATTGATT